MWYNIWYAIQFCLEAFCPLHAGSLQTCTSGATLCLDETTPLVKLYLLLFWTWTFWMEEKARMCSLLSFHSIFIIKLTLLWKIKKPFSIVHWQYNVLYSIPFFIKQLQNQKISSALEITVRNQTLNIKKNSQLHKNNIYCHLKAYNSHFCICLECLKRNCPRVEWVSFFGKTL